MRSVFSMFAIAAVATICGAAVAHEGHDHGKVMGTVKTVDAKASTIQVETADDKTVVCTVTAATKIARGGKAAAFADIKSGDRVVVALNREVTPPVAVEVKLAPEAAAPPQPPKHDHSSPHQH